MQELPAMPTSVLSLYTILSHHLNSQQLEPLGMAQKEALLNAMQCTISLGFLYAPMSTAFLM